MASQRVGIDVMAWRNGVEVQGHLNGPLPDDPIFAMAIVRQYLTEAMAIVFSNRPGEAWDWTAEVTVSHVTYPEDSTKEFEQWLCDQGVVKHFQWKEVPYMNKYRKTGKPTDEKGE